MRLNPCILPLALLLVACSATERQQYGYQTADLILHADELSHLATSTQYLPVATARRAYNTAVLAGDAHAMRAALNALNLAEQHLDATLGVQR